MQGGHSAWDPTLFVVSAVTPGRGHESKKSFLIASFYFIIVSSLCRVVGFILAFSFNCVVYFDPNCLLLSLSSFASPLFFPNSLLSSFIS